MNNYFSHDSNARNSDKLLPVRMKYGAEGYGIYFMLLERLREEADYMSVKDYNMLAFDLRVDTAKLKSIIEDFGLFAFTENGECFYSEGFKKRMELKDKKSNKLSEAGKRGAKKRWGSNGEEAKPKPSDSHPIANAIKNDSKKRKEKESKEKESKEDNNKKSELSSLSIHDYFQKNIGPENPAIIEGLEMWKDDLGDEVVKKAIEITALGDTRTFNYVQGILRNWVNRNLTTIDLINAAEQQRKAKNERRQNSGKKEVLPDWVDKTDQELEQEKPKESDPELAKQADAIKERLRRQREARQV
ncbi:DnaD domain protein [Listeria kieliensis]